MASNALVVSSVEVRDIVILVFMIMLIVVLWVLERVLFDRYMKRIQSSTGDDCDLTGEAELSAQEFGSCKPISFRHK